MAVTLTGIAELDRKLSRLTSRDAKRIARNALRAGLRVGAKQLRKEVPVAEHKEFKQAVGSSLKKDRSGVVQGKWGAGVGVSKKRRVKWEGRPEGDISNVLHLVLLGTVKRFQRSGRYTGMIHASDAVARAEHKSRNAVISTIREKVAAGIAALFGK